MAQSHYCVKLKGWLYASMSERKPQDQDKFVLRLPDGMRDRIKMVADHSGRSMNAEIVSALETSFPSVEQQLIEAMVFVLGMFPSMDRAERDAFVRKLNAALADQKRQLKLELGEDF